MQSQTRTNQGGSVINFLIVALVLLAIVTGVIYFAQKRGEKLATEPSTPVSTSPSAAPSSSMAPPPSSAPTTTPAPGRTPAAVPPTGVMPSTGPTDDLIQAALPLALITGLAVAYTRSRRMLDQSPTS